jgi:hypothetical protein
MPHVMPQVALHRIVQEGIYLLKQNPDVLDDIFQYYKCEEMNDDYGQKYIDGIKKWFTETKVPVVQAWSFNPQQVPQITIKLAVEQEDESKSAIGDHWGMGDEGNIGTAPFVVNLDIAIHASRNGDEVLWLYYIVNYILFKRKRRAEALGLQLHTFSATDYSRDNAKLADNIYTRYIRFRAVVQNFWDSEPYLDIDDLEVSIDFESFSS